MLFIASDVLYRRNLDFQSKKDNPMQKFQFVILYSILIVFLFSLSSCTSVVEMAGDLFPSPTPQPTHTPTPSVGSVGKTTEWGGWAVTVENVLRSSLDPRNNIPGNYYRDEFDYIGMDVTIQRTVEEKGNVDGEDFTLVDASGNVYEDYDLQTWIYDRGVYELNKLGSDRIVIAVPETAQALKLRFSPYPELPEPIEIALDQVKEPRRIDLREAIQLGLLDPQVIGVGLQSIEIQFEVLSSWKIRRADHCPGPCSWRLPPTCRPWWCAGKWSCSFPPSMSCRWSLTWLAPT
jgi:hypothetical protein